MHGWFDKIFNPLHESNEKLYYCHLIAGKRSASRASQIFLGKDDANSLLRTKRNLATGIVCECCVNRCSSRELNQYCAEPTRRRRSVRSIVTGGVAEPASPFTEDIVNKIYEEIAVESKVSQARTFTLDDYLKMEIVEENKRENILATSPPRDSGLPSGNLKKSLAPLNSDMTPISLTNYLNSNTDIAELMSKSLSAKHIHRHHKSLKRKHHHKS